MLTDVCNTKYSRWAKSGKSVDTSRQNKCFLSVSITKGERTRVPRLTGGVSSTADKKRGRQDMLGIMYVTMKNYNKRSKNVDDMKKTGLV